MSEFINLQLKTSAKKTLERAASFKGKTVSNYSVAGKSFLSLMFY
ncbi:hypothetical protein [Photorhabdus sp. SF281]